MGSNAHFNPKPYTARFSPFVFQYAITDKNTIDSKLKIGLIRSSDSDTNRPGLVFGAVSLIWKDELFVSGGTRWDGNIIGRNNQISKLTHEKIWDRVADLTPFRRNHLFEIIPHHEEDGLIICGGYTWIRDKWEFVKYCQTLSANGNLESVRRPKFYPPKTIKESSIRAQHLWTTTYIKHYRTIVYLRMVFKIIS